MYSINSTKYLTDAELTHLKRIIGQFRRKREMHMLLLEIAIATGARAQEVLNIKKSDINIEARSILIHGLKGSNDREIPINAELFSRLIDFSQRNDFERLFNICYSRLDQIWNEYRPVKKKFHALRHTFAIQMFMKTKNLKVIQLALGHKNLSTTNVYLDFIYNVQEMRQVMQVDAS